MAQTKTTITSLLSAAGTQPKHRFGQNFMVDQNLVRVIAEAGQPSARDLVIEIGPGTGTLTGTLLESGAEVLAVEIDRDLAGILREQFAGAANFRLIEGDALDGKHDLHPELKAAIDAKLAAGGEGGWASDAAGGGRGDGGAGGGGRGKGSGGVKLIANLPYNVASPLVVDLLMAGVGLLVFTVQKEVADRLKADAGDDAYGPITATVKMLGRVEVLRTLPPGAFWPPPKIDSALVRITREDRVGEGQREFARFVQTVFQARRKMLRKALSLATEDADAALAKTGIDGTIRCEELSPEQLFELWRAVRAGEG